MLKIGIIPNMTKADCVPVLEEFCGILSGRAELFVPAGEGFKPPEGTNVISGEEIFSAADIIVVMGGDGSLLGVSSAAALAGKPLLGINLGRVGYLASAEKENLEPVAEKLITGDYEINEYMMLKACYGGGEAVLALNDVVASRSEFGRIIEFSVFVDDEYVDTYTADGVVIATPTGSTAYSLSAGGPIAYPTMDMLVITPICPHGLSSRPIVIPADKKITVKLGEKYDYKALITVDGKIVSPMSKNDSFTVSKATVKTRLIKMNNYGFYDILRIKLKG